MLCMDGRGIRGTATVQMLKRLERGTEKVHELSTSSAARPRAGCSRSASGFISTSSTG